MFVAVIMCNYNVLQNQFEIFTVCELLGTSFLKRYLGIFELNGEVADNLLLLLAIV